MKVSINLHLDVPIDSTDWVDLTLLAVQTWGSKNSQGLALVQHRRHEGVVDEHNRFRRLGLFVIDESVYEYPELFQLDANHGQSNPLQWFDASSGKDDGIVPLDELK